MSDKLKPCPWCSHAPEVHELGVIVECVHKDGTRDAYEMLAVGCVNEECPVMPCTKASGSVAEAVEKWNARVTVTDEQFVVTTCRMVPVSLYDEEGIDGIECDECGWSDMHDWDDPMPDRCPGCKKKVVAE